jgi:hypothetical protein
MKKIVIILIVIIIGLVLYLNTSLNAIENLVESNRVLSTQLLILEEQNATLQPTNKERDQLTLDLNEEHIESILKDILLINSCEVEILEFGETLHVVIQTDILRHESSVEDIIEIETLVRNMFDMDNAQLTIIDETGQPYIEDTLILKHTSVDLNNDNLNEDIKLIMINGADIYLVVNKEYSFIGNVGNNLNTEDPLMDYIKFDLHTKDSIIVVGYHGPLLKYGSYSELKCYAYINGLRQVFTTQNIPGFTDYKIEGKLLTFKDYYGQYEYQLNEKNNDELEIRRLFDIEYIINSEDETITFRSLLQAMASPEIIMFYRQYQIRGAHLEVLNSGFDKSLEALFRNE